MKFGLSDRILQALIKELNNRKNITRAVIFGSRASDNYKYNSDIDLAVYSEGNLPPGLWADLDEAAGIYKIDVVDMNSNLDEKLRRKIEAQGMNIFERN